MADSGAISFGQAAGAMRMADSRSSPKLPSTVQQTAPFCTTSAAAWVTDLPARSTFAWMVNAPLPTGPTKATSRLRTLRAAGTCARMDFSARAPSNPP